MSENFVRRFLSQFRFSVRATMLQTTGRTIFRSCPRFRIAVLSGLPQTPNFAADISAVSAFLLPLSLLLPFLLMYSAFLLLLCLRCVRLFCCDTGAWGDLLAESPTL